MSKAIIYYSFSGVTRAYCEKLARETGAELFEVREKRKRGTFSAYTEGCRRAIFGGVSEIEILPPEADFSAYDEITIAGPVWASNTPPAVNAAIRLLPPGKDVTLVIIAGSSIIYRPGHAEEAIRARGCTLVETISLSAKTIAEDTQG